MTKQLNKHEATDLAKAIKEAQDRVKALKADNGIDELEKFIDKNRKALDAYTGKQDTDLFEGIKVVYTTVNNFSKKLLAEAHPEIDLDEYVEQSQRFKAIEGVQ